WEALNQQDLGTDYVVFAHLLDKDGKVIAQHDGAPNNSTEPTSAWVAGQIVTDPHTLTFLEGAAYTGPAALEIGIYDPRTFQRLTLPDGQDHIILPMTVTVD
ncbi:MAG: hypothetical protein LLG44_00130, partial [Chloroflexi bacterium]|nr:hypothetical protein [Chloroflexota bacterium]